ncbi:MAG: hypothetical protein HGA44_06870 [Cellulomonadaceae bacterium]|nr:hypothetical protein [Cellulomonadaceae bacterium]
MAELRRVAVVDGTRRVDLSVPAWSTVSGVLADAGVSMGEGAVAMIGDRAADAQGLVGDLPDGALLVVVEPGAEAVATAAAPRPAGVDPQDDAAWWLFGALGLVGLVAAVLRPAVQGWTAAGLGVVALVALLVAAGRRAGTTSGAARVAGPLLLAASAALCVVPVGLHGSAQLGVVVVAGSLGALPLVGMLVAPASQVRPVLGVTAAILLAVATLWLVVVALGWPVQAGAALTVGLVPLALRALPATLLRVPPGHFVEYGHFLRNPWSVRGQVPEAAGQVDREAVRAQVRASSSARVAGTVVIVAVGVTAQAFAVPSPPVGTLVWCGVVALLACQVVALMLLVRNEPDPVVRWVVRSAALGGLAVSAALLAGRLGDAWVPAVVLVGLALICAASVAPIARGRSSLSLSRLADMVQGLAVILSLPAALLAADGIELVRRAVSG